MKQIKKLASLLLALAMVFALSCTAFAAEAKTIQAGETYTAYKIFDATINGDNAAYSISKNSEWLTAVQTYAAKTDSGLTLTETADETGYLVTVGDGFSAETFAEELAKALTGKTAAGSAQAAKAEGTDAATVSIDVSSKGDGYYLVTSSLGSICQLTTAGTLTVVEKNTVPTIAKSADKTSATIGQEITYTLTFTDGTGTDLEATITDTMPSTLTYVADSLSWKIGETDATSTTNDVVKGATVNNGNITIKIDTSKLEKDATVVFTYKAYINDTASADTAITNTAKLEYSKQSDEASHTVNTFDFDLQKTDGTNQLDGAEFTLYADEDHTDAVTLIAVEDGYKVYDGKTTLSDGATTTSTITAGKVNVAGLAAGTYYLVESKAPAGYNLLTSDVVITISGTGTVAVNGTEGTVTVVNTAGSTLPTTGGMGTTIFYIAGAILVLGAGVVLVTRRRMNGAK